MRQNLCKLVIWGYNNTHKIHRHAELLNFRISSCTLTSLVKHSQKCISMDYRIQKITPLPFARDVIVISEYIITVT